MSGDPAHQCTGQCKKCNTPIQEGLLCADCCYKSLINPIIMEQEWKRRVSNGSHKADIIDQSIRPATVTTDANPITSIFALLPTWR